MRELGHTSFAGHYNCLIILVNYYTIHELTFAQFVEIQFEINVRVKPFSNSEYVSSKNFYK